MLPRLMAVITAAAAAATVFPETTSAQENAADTCDAVEVEYAVAANLRIRGTVLGAGNGDHGVGPGRVVLRFDRRGGAPGGKPIVTMTACELLERFVVVSKALFWNTRVTTDVRMHATTTSSSSGIAEGALEGRSLRWTNIVGTFRSDGTLQCDGSMCGRFGAPPTGSSELHLGPTKVVFEPFEFNPDMKTFSMASTLASKSESPRQETYLAFSGREVRRDCVAGAR